MNLFISNQNRIYTSRLKLWEMKFGLRPIMEHLTIKHTMYLVHSLSNLLVYPITGIFMNVNC